MADTYYQFPENDLLAENEAKDRPIYSFMDILKQHQFRCYVNLSTGESIRFKFLSKKENDRILAYIQLIYPDYFNYYQKYTDTVSKIENIDLSDEKNMQQFLELMEKATEQLIVLKPAIELMSIGVIEQPCLWDRDSVDAFYSKMRKKDRDMVFQIVSDMSAPIPLKFISFDEYWVAQKFGLKILDEDCLTNMTLTQANAIAEITRQEKIEYDKQVNKMRAKHG